MLLDKRASAFAIHWSIAERNCGDWTASGRWASAAFQAAVSDRQRLIAAIYEGEAAIVTEEAGQVCLAIDHLKPFQVIPELCGDNVSLRWTLRQLRAVRAYIRLLAIESRLSEGVSLAEKILTGFANADGGLIGAYLAQIRVEMLALMIRRLELKKGGKVASDVEKSISRLLPKASTSSFAGRIVTHCIKILYEFYIQSGEINRCEYIYKTAKELKAQARDIETNYGCTRVMAIHAGLVEPAEDALDLFEDLLDYDTLKGRIDRIVDNNILHDCIRLQFNAGKLRQAQQMLTDMLDFAQRRRSRYIFCLLKMEQLYQNSFFCRNNSALFQEILSFLPKEELFLRFHFKADYEWHDESAEEQSEAKIASLNELMDQAREYGSCWIEGKACGSALELIQGNWDEELFSTERILRAEYLAAIFKDNLLGSNIISKLSTNVLTSYKNSPDLTSFHKALYFLDQSRRTRERLNVPGSVILSWLCTSQILADGSIYSPPGSSYGAGVLPLSMDSALQAVNEGIAFSESQLDRAEQYIGLLYCQRAELLRRLSKFDCARIEGERALELARKTTNIFQLTESINSLACIERDVARWSVACDWLETGIKELLSFGPHRTPHHYLDTNVMVDLIDGSSIPNTEEQEDSEPRGTLIENIPRVAGILRDYLILIRAYTASQAFSFNDFWYCGDILNKANQPEAIWFLGAAIYKDGIERLNKKVEAGRDTTISMLRMQIDKITKETGVRPDLVFNPNVTIQSLKRKYGILPEKLKNYPSSISVAHPPSEPEDVVIYHLLNAIWSNNIAQVELILASGANSNLVDEDGISPLTNAVRMGHHQIVQSLLSFGADINQSFKGWTPLHYACDVGKLETVEVLLTHSDRELLLDSRDLAGWTPLMLATRKGDISVIKMLLEAGANRRIVNCAGLDALALAIQSGNLLSVREFVAHELYHPPGQVSSIALESQSQSCAGFSSPALSNAAIVSSSYPNSDHLNLAVATGDLEMIRTLIEAGASPHQPDNLGDTALHHAARLGYDNVARLLVQQAVPLDASDREMRTPIDVAAENGNEIIVEFLISKGCPTPSHWNYPRVSDQAAFLRFEPVSKSDEIWLRTQLIKQKITISSDKAVFRIAYLPFYNDGVLIAIEDPNRRGRREEFALAKLGQEMVMLNWTNEPIYSLNEKWGLLLGDDDLALLYTRFFFFFVRGDLGRFEIIERIEEIDWQKDVIDEFKQTVSEHLCILRVVDRSERNIARLKATLLFKKAIFQIDILVAIHPCERLDEDGSSEKFTIGQVKLLNEQLLCEDLPVKVPGPPGVFG